MHQSLGGGSYVGAVGDGVERYKVYSAVEPAEQFDNLVKVVHLVVESLEEDVLKREAALVRAFSRESFIDVAAEVLVSQHLNHILYRIRFLCRHVVGSVTAKGEVEADSKVATAFADESLHALHQSYG